MVYIAFANLALACSLPAVISVDEGFRNESVIYEENGATAGNTPPPKPWERAGSSSGPAPFKPPSSGNTSEVVEASGTAKPGEVVSNVNTAATRNTLARPVPTRPWQQNYGNSYGGIIV